MPDYTVFEDGPLTEPPVMLKAGLLRSGGSTLEIVETNITLDIYNHDTTPSTIKAIALDSNTRYVAAALRNADGIYDLPTNAMVELYVLRPDNNGVQVIGSTYSYDGDGGTQIYGAYAELTQLAIAKKGACAAQFKITVGEQILRTEIFTISVGRALDADIEEWAGSIDGYNLDEMAESIVAVKEKLQEYEDIFTGNVDESVQNWLDAHPEATTTLQDGSVTEPKLASALKSKVLNPYVTPEMFGAAGNGSTDDTQAVQAALDAEANCCLIGRYKITDTLIWNKRGKEGKNVFGMTNIRFSHQCHLVFDLADRTKPCIELQSDGFTMQKVSVKGADPRTQTLIKTNNTAVDIDMSILNCSIYNFDTVVDITGRGLDISNSLIAGCSVIAKIAWSSESEGVYHDDITGQRAYNLCNNRIHSVGKANSPLIQLASGNLYGFRFVNNNIDRGYSSLLRAYGNARNWLISGNTFSGVMGYGSNLIFIGIDGAVEQVTISNNNFTQVETNTLTARILSIGGATNGLVFTGNSFGEIINTMLIYFGQSVKNSILSDNLLLKNALMTTVRGLFTIAAALLMENTDICNNVVGEVSTNTSTNYNQYILRCTGALTLRNVKMIGNVRPLASKQSNIKDYSIGTPIIENCLFDWELDEMAEQISTLESSSSTLMAAYEDTHADSEYYITKWTQGTIGASNGTNSNSTTRCRADGYFTNNVLGYDTAVITIAEGFKLAARIWDETMTYKGAYPSDWASGQLELPLNVGYSYRFVISKSNNGAISPSDITANAIKVQFTSMSGAVYKAKCAAYNSPYNGRTSTILAAKTFSHADGTHPTIDWYLLCDYAGDMYISKDLKSRAYITTRVDWNQYKYAIRANGDIVAVYRTEFLTAGSTYDSSLDDSRQNPLVCLASEGYSEWHEVNFGTAKKPCGWVENSGVCLLPNGDLLFGEYTRMMVMYTANLWRIKAGVDITDSTNWEILKTFTVAQNDTATYDETVIEHFHCVQVDPYTGTVYFTTGDKGNKAQIWYSTDNGDTWTNQALNGQTSGEELFRLVNFCFTANKVYWVSDDPENHVVISCNRGQNGLDSTSATVLATMASTDGRPATYGQVLYEDLGLIVMLDRLDTAYSQMPFRAYDIVDDEIKLICTIMSATGANANVGFRTEYTEFDPEDGVIKMGFGNNANYLNRNAICGNPAKTFAENINNLSLRISMDADRNVYARFGTYYI